MDERELARLRMHRQRLWADPLPGAAEVVRVFGAMQAQEYLPAKWALAQRSRSAVEDGAAVTDADVEAALAEGSILRTHILRPTWHFIHRDDARKLLAVSAPRVHRLNAYYYRQTGVEGEIVVRTQDVLRRELGSGTARTRRELGAALAEAGLPSAGLALGYVMMRAELDAVVISGPRRGRQQTYLLFDDRVPRTGPDPDPDPALAELTRQYFSTRGPATVKDFATWASLTVQQVRHGLDLLRELGERVERTTTADLELLELPPPVPSEIAAQAHRWNPADHWTPADRVDLLQGYDEVGMSYSETRISPLAQRMGGGGSDHPHTIVLDGRLIGRWRHVTTSRTVTVETQLHTDLTPAQERALDREVERFGAFLGLPATRA